MMPPTATWTPVQRALWQRIAAHSFEDPDRPLDFTARLAREQGCSRDTARTMIDEYRRFCFLAVATAGEMTPNAEVDEVWHLHLTYSRDYWEVFCPKVLRTALHHGPTGGRREDDARYRVQYAETLAVYAAYFDSPPERFWPASTSRFARPDRFRRVDLARTWLLPRPQISLRRAVPWLMLAAMLAPLSALALPSNPLDWTAGPFLTLYSSLLVGFVVLTQVWRRRTGGDRTPHPIVRLDLWQTAQLADGAERVTDHSTGQKFNMKIK